MEGILESVMAGVSGHERQLLIAAETAVLATLFTVLVLILRRRRQPNKPRRARTESIKPSLPRAEVEARYRQEAHIIPQAPLPAEAATEMSEIFPPELSRRIDALEKRLRGLAGRSGS